MALFGQASARLNGRIWDAESGRALVAASISIDRRAGVISDDEGCFSFQLDPGKHVLEIYYVGYQTLVRELELQAGSNDSLLLPMLPERLLLDEVVVSAGKYAQKIADVSVSIDLIKPAQLSKQNIVSLDQILERSPGVSILDGQPSIRGGSGFAYGVGSRVLMLVDDLPMISADAGDIKWSYMPVENIHQVEVIKGGSSVLYGSAALNGVINLRTRFPGNDPSTELTTYGGIYMDPRRKELIWRDRRPFYRGASVSHLRKIGRSDLSLGMNYHKDEGYREGDYEHRIRGNLALRHRFQKLPGLSIGLSTSYMFIDQGDFLLWLNADSGAYRQRPDVISSLIGHRYNIDPYIEYQGRNGNRHSLRTRLYSVGNATFDKSRSAYSKLWYGEYRYLKKLNGGSHWTSGLSFSRNTVVANLYLNHRGSNAALYTQYDARITPRLKASGGIRWEINTLNDNLYYSLPVLRAGLNLRLSKAAYLRASIGQGYRFPSVAEKFADADIGGLKVFPNPELEPERGWSAELGLRQGLALGSWEGMVDLALFHTAYKHMIEYTFGVYPPDSVAIPTIDHVGFKALNIGTARISGLEFSTMMTGRIGPVGLSLTGAYTWMDPVDPLLLDSLGRDEDLAYVLKYRRRHLLKADGELEFGQVFAGLNLQYNSRMINVDEIFIDPLIGDLLQPGFPDYWRTRAGGYVLVDFRLGWEVGRHIRLTALLKNAFNKEYLGRPGDLGAPRSFSLQLRLLF